MAEMKANQGAKKSQLVATLNNMDEHESKAGSLARVGSWLPSSATWRPTRVADRVLKVAEKYCRLPCPYTIADERSPQFRPQSNSYDRKRKRYYEKALTPSWNASATWCLMRLPKSASSPGCEEEYQVEVRENALRMAQIGAEFPRASRAPAPQRPSKFEYLTANMVFLLAAPSVMEQPAAGSQLGEVGTRRTALPRRLRRQLPRS